LHQLVRRELRLLADVASWTAADDAGHAAALARHAELVGRVLLHHHAVERDRLWPALRRSLLGADALVCISAAVARQLGGPGARVTIVYDGLARIPERPPREPARAALGLPDERFAVALLGRVSEWKGQDVLARALAEPPLAEIGAIGLVAGDAFHGRERHERALAALRAELGLGERLRVLGFRDDVGPVLGAVDAVAMPSTRPEPLGNSALEAAAAGLPVVASAHGGLAEVVRDGETGRLVPPGDARALALALRELADHPEGARALGEAATRDVRARFSRERMLAELEWVYERLLPREGERAFDPRGMGSNARSSRSDVP
jgi:glycosyltransferase involved in cell wall biosynthesis